ncbi:MAG: hypothetical protein LW606_03400 [Ilumatobacteraceae bacterium]|nr:hypothetical protein [Ilumatobacteraceae bacterium]
MSTSEKVVDLVDSVKLYAKQETIGPLRGAGRWLLFGLAAALSLGVSMLFAILGVLRLAQHIGGDILDGSWSFVAYVIALLAAVALVVLSLSRVNKPSLSRGGASHES